MPRYTQFGGKTTDKTDPYQIHFGNQEAKIHQAILCYDSSDLYNQGKFRQSCLIALCSSVHRQGMEIGVFLLGSVGNYSLPPSAVL